MESCRLGGGCTAAVGFYLPLQPGVSGKAHLGAQTEQAVGGKGLDAPEVERITDGQLTRMKASAAHAHSTDQRVEHPA